MRKIQPRAITKLRDPFAIIRDNKIIADQNIWSLGGDLLTPNGYPIPRFSNNIPFVGDAVSPSISATNIANGGLVADNGRAAACGKNVRDLYGSLGALRQVYTSVFTELSAVWNLGGFDSFLPGVWKTTKGPTAGRYIARHPNGYMDVTSDSQPTVLEIEHVTVNSNVGAQTASGGTQYTYNSRILDEKDTDVLTLSYGISQNSAQVSAGDYYPLRPISKLFTTSGAAASVGFRGAANPIYLDSARRFMLQWHPNASSNAYGTTGLPILLSSTKWSADLSVTFKWQNTQQVIATLDAYAGSSQTTLPANTGAGWKVYPAVRAVKPTAAGATIYLPVLTGPATAQNNIIKSGSLRKLDYDYATDLTTVSTVNIFNQDGSAFVFNEEMMPVPGAGWNQIPTITAMGSVAHFELSFLQTVGAETYLVVLRVGSGSTRRPTSINTAPNIAMNTVQYVMRLDKNDLTKAYMVNVEVLPGFFGLTNEAMYSFAQNKEGTAIYVLGHESVMRLNWDSTQLKYVLDQSIIDVNAVSMIVTDSEDLVLLDTDNKLYSLRREDSDIVRIAWGPTVNQDFAEAPFDADIIVNTVNHLGERKAKTVELYVEGPAVFKANNRNKITVTTNADSDLGVLLTVKGYGQVYVTPLSVA